MGSAHGSHFLVPAIIKKYSFMTSSLTTYLSCLAAANLLPWSLCAQPTDSDVSPQWFEHSTKNAWLLPSDTTLISRRTFTELSYANHGDDENFWKIENSLRSGFAITENLALGLQLMVPVKWNDTATSNASGIGDLELRSGFVGRISPTLRWGAGVNAAFDTAEDSVLGDNALVLRPILALRLDANDWINWGINVEYNFTPQEERDDDVSALELKFPVVIKISEHWSGIANYKPRWDLLSDSDRHRIEIGATRLWGAEKQIALSFSIEIPLVSENLDYKLTSGIAWNF